MEMITMIAYVAGALGVLFGGIAWMIHVQISPIKDLLKKSESNQVTKEMFKAQITPIKDLLANHITDTNKKIEALSGRIDKLADRFDKMSDRFDRQNDQFVRLYELVIKEK